MRSGSRKVGPAAVLAGLLVLATPFARAQPPPPRESPPITRSDITAAIEQAQADPNLSAERTIRVLQWRSSPRPPRTWGLFEWIAGLFRWVAETGRVLVWVVALLLGGLLAAWLVRLLDARRAASRGAGIEVPTHVRDLDIRPASLPSDVGAAARDLWDRGEHRAALALLYRGLLSRLVHVHGVPVRDSTTEGDLLALAAAHLPPDRLGYATRLVGAWGHSVYGGRLADTSTVHAICAQFATALARVDAAPPPVPLTAGGGQ